MCYQRKETRLAVFAFYFVVLLIALLPFANVAWHAEEVKMMLRQGEMSMFCIFSPLFLGIPMWIWSTTDNTANQKAGAFVAIILWVMVMEAAFLSEGRVFMTTLQIGFLQLLFAVGYYAFFKKKIFLRNKNSWRMKSLPS